MGSRSNPPIIDHDLLDNFGQQLGYLPGFTGDGASNTTFS